MNPAPPRKPGWLKVRIPHTDGFARVNRVVSSHGLHTVCREARCPNISECFDSGTATFLVLGDVCTRNCLYCNVRHGTPAEIDGSEPERVAEAVAELGLDYVVITSVTRDDLPDGGADIFAGCIRSIRRTSPDCRVEALVPDFGGNGEALDRVLDAGPCLLNHNMEVVKPLFPALRPQGNYDASLEVLRHASAAGVWSKSGLMIGFGERREDIIALAADLRETGCRSLTIGQYLQPSRGHLPVRKYYTPSEFLELEQIARDMGFSRIESGPLVRSSYRAARSGCT
ncbi:MAG: lipoyl synthase [Syntrophales bacterium]|nr:lipoyl synthase [Syntrophales bacterium]MDD5232608.1 lipoyl synthase [Syntrophales bacterium]MDD5533613.1 lipoyl synthase [Syntrophales bacterium]HPL62176.1 lipoyl synthase [Syntrophales bacterium]